MPIKFRCVHCGQYLGISRSKAGTIVDCPTCGRSVGVPQKDGQAEPVGRPSLNHEDSELAKALQEVAAIAQSSSVAVPHLPARQHQRADARETREVHAPPPEVIPKDPLPPAEPIDPESPAKAEADQPVSGEEETYYARVPFQHLQTLAGVESPADPPAQAVPLSSSSPWTHEVSWKRWLAVVLVGFIALVAGFALGRWDLSREPVKQTPAVETPGESTVPPQTPLNTTTDVVTELGQVALTGTITYSEGGQGTAIKPDENAWIYAFPTQQEPPSKIPADWYSSQSSQADPADTSLVVSALQVLGGNATQADAQGRFEVGLIHPGSYLVLVCSDHQSTHPDDTSRKAPPEILKDYLENVEEFLANRRCQWQTVDYQGEAVALEMDPF